jgi:hypothetical protein
VAPGRLRRQRGAVLPELHRGPRRTVEGPGPPPAVRRPRSATLRRHGGIARRALSTPGRTGWWNGPSRWPRRDEPVSFVLRASVRRHRSNWGRFLPPDRAGSDAAGSDQAGAPGRSARPSDGPGPARRLPSRPSGVSDLVLHCRAPVVNPSDGSSEGARATRPAADRPQRDDRTLATRKPMWLSRHSGTLA